MARRAWLLVVAVLLAAAVWLPAGAAGAQGGEWVPRYCWGWWVCGWEWRPHDHEAENRRKREQECYDNYLACYDFCRTFIPPERKADRRECYADCAQRYAECLKRARGR